MKRRTEGLRDRAVAAALKLLAEDGSIGLTARNVAREAAASTPAVYELFGDKGGLIREVFFEGFRMLRTALEEVERTDDPVHDLKALAFAHRSFAQQYPALADVMFSRPFADFDPASAEAEGGVVARRLVVNAVQRAVDDRCLSGDPKDVAHVFVATVQGLSAAERSRRLGRSKASVDRRWDLGINAVLRGLAPSLDRSTASSGSPSEHR